MSAPAESIVFVGVGTSAVERRSERGILAFALDAAVDALADAGLTRDDIDGYVGAPLATNAGALHADGGDEVCARTVTDALGIKRLAVAFDLFKAFPTDMVIAAAQALQSRACNVVLGVRALYNPADAAYSTGTVERAWGLEQFRAPYGYSAGGARFATRAQRYLHESGATRRDLYDVVSLARRNARDNPQAIWRDRAITLDEYLASPIVSSPLCRLDCDMPVCGAAAFVMTRAGNAAGLRHRPVHLAGWSQWQGPERIFERAKRSRADIDLLQLYDGFSTMTLEFLETLGWCASHQALRDFATGRFERNGPLPLNTFGGSLGEGRLHGMGHIREAVLQVSGRAGPRQVGKADNCYVQVGPYDCGSSLILSASAA